MDIITGLDMPDDVEHSLYSCGASSSEQYERESFDVSLANTWIHIFDFCCMVEIEVANVYK